MQPYKLPNGNIVYTTCDPSRYHLCPHMWRAEMDVESIWQAVSYIGDKAYDFKDIATLFVDGGSAVALWQLHVAFGIIALVFGILFGLWLMHMSHKQEQKKE